MEVARPPLCMAGFRKKKIILPGSKLFHLLCLIVFFWMQFI